MKHYIIFTLSMLLVSCSPSEAPKDVWHLMSSQVFESTSGRIYSLSFIHDTGEQKMLVCVSHEETHNDQFEPDHFYTQENGVFHGISHIPGLEAELIKTMETTSASDEKIDPPTGHVYYRKDGKNIEILSGSDEEQEFLSILERLDIRSDQASQIHLVDEFKNILLDRTDLINLEPKTTSNQRINRREK